MSALRDDRLERDPERDSLSRLERDSLGRLVDPKRHHMQQALHCHFSNRVGFILSSLSVGL